jgi:preprotein translocase subunit SecB
MAQKLRTLKSQDFGVLSLEVDSETKMRGGNPRKWRSKVTVQSRAEQGKVYPYSFRIEYTGFFTVADEFPEEFVEQMVKTNAPAVLYSSAREALMFLTGRGRLRAVLLPSVTFLEPPKSYAQKQNTPPCLARSKKRPPALLRPWAA